MARPKLGVTFWDRVNENTVIEANGCHLFNGHRNDDGYARISKDGKLVFVHREIFKKHNPEVEITGVVMHTCDTPNCINPKHLRHGTQADNVKDMKDKGRGNYLTGSAQSQAKLTEANVVIIKQKLEIGVTSARLARDFNVSEAAIQNIKKGRRWTHVK
jgi:hypothetical protein